MSRKLKRVEKILNLPAEIRFDEVDKLLDDFEFTPDNIEGSHYTYVRGEKILVIIKQKNKVNREYLKRIIDYLNLEEWYENHKK